jgi:hypothetical protein
MTNDEDVPDVSLGSLRDWDRLIAALSEATDDAVETSYLELKGPLNLAGAEDRFAIAKAVLAFANRDPAAAAPFLDGCAVILIGMSWGTSPAYGGSKITSSAPR